MEAFLVLQRAFADRARDVAGQLLCCRDEEKSYVIPPGPGSYPDMLQLFAVIRMSGEEFHQPLSAGAFLRGAAGEHDEDQLHGVTEP